MKLEQTVTLSPEEVKLACILYLRESATGRTLQSLAHPERVRVQYRVVCPVCGVLEEFCGLELVLPEINIGKLGDDDGLGG